MKTFYDKIELNLYLRQGILEETLQSQEQEKYLRGQKEQMSNTKTEKEIK